MVYCFASLIITIGLKMQDYLNVLHYVYSGITFDIFGISVKSHRKNHELLYHRFYGL